jgi:hypothetical protein
LPSAKALGVARAKKITADKAILYLKAAISQSFQ